MTRVKSVARPALDIRGRLLSMTRLRVLEPNLPAIEEQLDKLRRQMGAAGEGMPVVLESEEPLDMPPLLDALRRAGLVPLAVLEGALAESARACGLAVLSPELLVESTLSRAARRPAAAPEPAVAPPPPQRRPTRVVFEPVRSGQQIYAKDGDLVVLGTVNPGGEVIADGCVHVYGSLRGRAIAGALGDTAARVFTRRNEAELLAVAGIYTSSDQMAPELRGVPAQAYWAENTLRIEKLEG